jgi:hypothetical protein
MNFARFISKLVCSAEIRYTYKPQVSLIYCKKSHWEFMLHYGVYSNFVFCTLKFNFLNWHSGGWVESNWVHSALRPPIGLFCTLSMSLVATAWWDFVKAVLNLRVPLEATKHLINWANIRPSSIEGLCSRCWSVEQVLSIHSGICHSR